MQAVHQHCSYDIGINCKTKLDPLAQSVKRIHGKEKLGLFSSSGDKQEQPFAQIDADRSIWIK